MTLAEVITRLNLMIEPGQDANNEALKIAIATLLEKAKWRED